MKKSSGRKECMCHFQEREHVQKPFQQWKDEDWAEEMYGVNDDVYRSASRDRDLENDGLSSWEAAFMEGYEWAA